MRSRRVAISSANRRAHFYLKFKCCFCVGAWVSVIILAYFVIEAHFVKQILALPKREPVSSSKRAVGRQTD
jgi:hypothetical protein